MSLTKTITLFLILAFIVFGIYCFFIDTLSFSELLGHQSDPMASIFINLFDFNTGLTRWNVYNLKKKALKWEVRERQILSIQNPGKRRIEYNKLMSEMMQDPAFRKLAQKVFGKGAKGIQGLLKGIINFSIF